MKLIFTSFFTSATIILSAQVPTDGIVFAHSFSNTYNPIIPEGLEPSSINASLVNGPQMDPTSALGLTSGQSLQFYNDFIQAGATNGQASVSLKFRADADFIGEMPDFSYANLYNSGDVFIRIQKTTGYYIQVGLYNDNNGNFTYGYITANFEVGPDQLSSWNTVTMTYDGNPLEQEVALYLNGQDVATVNQGNECSQGGNVIYLNYGMTIGGIQNQPFVGTIDEVYIHNRTLTPEEAVNIYFSQSFVGINELENHSLNLYPNPVLDVINLEGFNNENIDIINAQGAKVMTQRMTIGRNQWDLNTLPSGIYFIKTSQGSTKFVKG